MGKNDAPVGATAENSRHPFFVSVTAIEQNAAAKTLEVSCKLFADDFEHTLEKDYKTQLDITSEKDKATLDKIIPDYISKHLSLVADGRAVKLNYIGFERDHESVYCYFEVNELPSVRRLDATNTLLYGFTKDQINIMHITLGGKRQSFKLNYPDAKVSYK